MGQFHGKLITEENEGKKAILLENLFFYSDFLKKTFLVPAGFDTDFCSVPRIPFIYSWLGNRFKKSGALHDNLYRNGIISRADADTILREATQAEGATLLESWAMWAAVRIFGGQYYKPNFITYRQY